mgnify:CR=1 FL=1
MIRLTPNCKHNVNGQCSRLRVKCLESRFMGIGGVEFGHCTIREAVPFPPMPKGVRPSKRAGHRRWEAASRSEPETEEAQAASGRVRSGRRDA